MKHAIITAFLGLLRDRFCEYQEPRTFEEKLDLMRRIPGVSGAEVVHPYEVPEPAELLALCAARQLEVSAVNVNVKADRDFVEGSISSPRSRRPRQGGRLHPAGQGLRARHRR